MSVSLLNAILYELAAKASPNSNGMKTDGIAIAVSSSCMLTLASSGRLLKMTTPTAPAAVALAIFSEKVIVPRLMSASFPVKSRPSKSEA